MMVLLSAKLSRGSYLEGRLGEVRALVSGSEIYEVNVRIQSLAAARWNATRRECAGQIGTLVGLLQEISAH